MDGFEVTKFIKSTYPKIKVLALTMHDDDNFILRLLEYGVNGYLLKDNGSSYIAKAIREVSNPESTGNFFTERISQAMYKGLKNRQQALLLPDSVVFSSKELSIIKLICEEYTTPEIAKELNMSPHTVNGHREKIMMKIKVKSTIGIVNYAHKHNLIFL
jgi:two-component system, NarL family, response regulator DegU